MMTVSSVHHIYSLHIHNSVRHLQMYIVYPCCIYAIYTVYAVYAIYNIIINVYIHYVIYYMVFVCNKLHNINIVVYTPIWYSYVINYII